MYSSTSTIFYSAFLRRGARFDLGPDVAFSDDSVLESFIFAFTALAFRSGRGSSASEPVTFAMRSRDFSILSLGVPSRFRVGGGRSTATRAPQSVLLFPRDVRDVALPREVDGIDTERSGFFDPVSIAEILSSKNERLAGCALCPNLRRSRA